MKFEPEIALAVLRKSVSADGPVLITAVTEVRHAQLMEDCGMIEGTCTTKLDGSAYYLVTRATAKAHAATLWQEAPKDIRGFM